MFPRPRYVFLDHHGRFLDDRGMSTTEYAVGLIAAAAMATALFLVANSGSVEAGLTSLIERALDFGG
jgi:hypothetical protein